MWDPSGARLLWLDVPAPGRLFQFDTHARDVDFFQFEHAVTGLARVAAGHRLLLAGEREIWTLDPGNLQTNIVARLPDEPPLHRFNDGAVDAAGRFWVGSMPNNLAEPYRSASHLNATGRMYVVSGDGSMCSFEHRFACPNAICWSPDGTVLYAADSVSGWIHAYEFDAAAAEIRHGRPFCRLDGLGIPDGAAVDADGYIWNARWGAGVVAKIDPRGRLAETIALPVTNPTACCFGGAAGRTLYVTSARYGLDPGQLLRETHAGSVFAIETSSRGTASNTFNPAAAGVARGPQNNDSR
ncbi:MAG: SMP-30/gluconolactonase/LRE family protein [Proteobacteria bacterium]|nr:SMP-30/gluconolactonase/LRE family protein [Pseudomonadota bacterium]